MILNFKNWLIDEGFRVDYSRLPPYLQAPESYADYPASLNLGNIRKQDRKWIIDRLHEIEGSIVFDFDNHPEDFIEIKELNYLDVKPSARLSSFRSSVLYGLKFDMSKDKVASFFREKIKELTQELDNLLNQRANISTQIKKPDMVIIWKLYNEIIRNNNYPVENDSFWNKLTQIVLTNKTYGQYSGKKPTINQVKKVVSFYQHAGGNLNLSQLNKLIPMVSDALGISQTNIENINVWRNMIQQSFLKKIKNPINAHDQTMSDRFVDLSADNFMKFYSNNYECDYVLYPQSSSFLNEKLAKKLADKIGCEAVLGFTKKPRMTIDTHNLKKKVGDSKFKISHERLRRFTADSDGEIKNVDKNQQFVRNMNLNADFFTADRISSIRKYKMKFLIIDDNFRTGGTLQDINKIMRNSVRPDRIDYYVPLFANFS